MTTRHTNRLSREASPYLLLHAGNPVDWYPWGPEAFAAARARDVPIFLSIGYSTCYWCHVMERESFENEAIAALLNEHMVAVKVDREERPDVDEIYMAATVMTNGHGGWPMSVFLDPATLRPFYCGTYFPPEAREGMGRPSFPQIVEGVSRAWRENRQSILEHAATIAAAVDEHLSPAPPAALTSEHVSQAVSQLLKMYDRAQGGFGQAPKFPQPVFIEFLLDARESAADDATADAIDQSVRGTLDAMMIGGLFDHLAGGFHRYCVDAHWTVPHFEKMLYDNAQLAALYARAAAFYNDDEYARTARRVTAWLANEMTDPATGAFWSAQDAQVNGREGLNYLWTQQTFRDALTPAPSEPDDAGVAQRDAQTAEAVYGLSGPPNFQDPHHPAEPPSYVLRTAARPERLARSLDITPDALQERLSRAHARLMQARAARPQPSTDDKVILSWNAMMVSALARVSVLLGDAPAIAAAQRAAGFLLGSLRDERGGLARCVRQGVVSGRAVLEDYAALTQACIDLARATSDPAWLAHANATISAAAGLGLLGERMHDAPAESDDLFVRGLSTHDGAMPSGASIMLNALIDLSEVTDDPAHAKRAAQLLATISGRIAQSPVGVVNSTRALLRLLQKGGLWAEVTPNAASQPAPLRRAEDVDPVEIYASVERVSLSMDRPASFTLLVKIAQGWHIAAPSLDEPPHESPHEPPANAPMLSPFRVGVINGQGVEAYADYPPAEPFAAPGQAAIPTYSGTFELQVVLEQTGQMQGRPLLSVWYQACSEGECLAPSVVELDIAIDPG
jgi:uncharacterized protein YyaL (SSP411 family)